MRNLFQIREISTISFNERVLQEAEDARNPLLERLKFLGIFSSNMDEFFKVRVASIHRRIALGQREMVEVLEAVSRKARELDGRQRAAYASITSELANQGIEMVTEKDLLLQDAELQDWVRQYFRDKVLPTLVPIIVSKDRPLPQLTDGALYLAVEMLGKDTTYAILEIPDSLPRFVNLPSGNIMYVDDVTRFCLSDLFYIFSYDRVNAYEFKVSRDAELDVDNDFAEDYVRMMEETLQQRKGGRPTRLVYDAAMPSGVLLRLLKELNISEEDTLIGGGRYHNMKDLMKLPAKQADLLFESLPAAQHPVLDMEDRRPILESAAENDLLITYPYQSFDHLLRLLREAAIDPEVASIKMTLYRAARNSRVVNALYNAARNGKRVFVNIELQARFDEQHNIEISEKLSEVGAAVVYGVPPMKTHSKLLLIERRDGQRVAGISTGNFNEVTGGLYVDSTLLTADPRLTDEVERVLSFLHRASRMRMLNAPSFKHLLVSPFNTRRVLYQELNRERSKGKDGYVFLKVNHLTDEKMIQRIRSTANAGVKMDLVVRTTYAVLPHPNIRAISILDRYLEHQRVYIFGKGEDCRVYLSSADLMERNLDWRIECAFPVYDPSLKKLVCHMMELQVADRFKARILDEMQSNRYVQRGSRGKRAQYATHRYFEQLAEKARKRGAAGAGSDGEDSAAKEERPSRKKAAAKTKAAAKRRAPRKKTAAPGPRRTRRTKGS